MAENLYIESLLKFNHGQPADLLHGKEAARFLDLG